VVNTIARLLEAIDEATERGRAAAARRLLQQCEPLVRGPLDRVLVDVRWAFIPGGRPGLDEATLDQAKRPGCHDLLVLMP
jgi:hypothetical protein